jgi:hypothetical protein
MRVKPDSYNKGPQTMGATEKIDKLFSNDEIEWFTNRGCSLYFWHPRPHDNGGKLTLQK